jgi:glycosyltransferase involved in cell wall biosynthesis
MTAPVSREARTPTVMLVGPGPDRRGGIGQFNMHLAAALARDGLRVAMLTFAKLYPRWTRPGRQGGVEPPPPQFEEFRELVPWAPFTWVSGARSLRRVRPEVVVFQWWHPMFAFCYAALAMVARRRRIRVAFVCHNVEPHESFPLSTFLTRLALRRADRVFTLSGAVERDVLRLLPAASVLTLGHPPYTSLVQESESAASRWRARIDRQGRKTILFFGNVRPYKGLPDLIDAVVDVRAQLPVVLVVAGTFFEDIETYRAQIARLGLAPDVVLVPEYVPDDEVGELLRLADVIVLPYRSGTQTGVLPLAAELGKPAVVTSVGGIAEGLGPLVRVCPPRSPRELGAAIVATLLDPGPPPPHPSVTWDRWAREIEVLAHQSG